MKIGIGLPATIPGAPGALILEWARRADAGPFSSLGVLDRLVYPNYEPLITLAAAVGVTQRLRLMTTVLLAPLRSGAMLAKQAASLDALSKGRLTLGLGIGGREDDYRAIGIAFGARGKQFEAELALMRRVWARQPLADDVGPVGPPPARQGGPEVLLGGYAPAAIRRAGRLGDGYISGGGADPNQLQQAYRLVEEAWTEAGRSGRPRFVGAVYYALGPDARSQGAPYLRDYYGMQPQMAEGIANSFPATAEAVKQVIDIFTGIGTDEIVLWPTIPDLEQVDRLADLVS